MEPVPSGGVPYCIIIVAIRGIAAVEREFRFSNSKASKRDWIQALGTAKEANGHNTRNPGYFLSPSTRKHVSKPESEAKSGSGKIKSRTNGRNGSRE